MQTDELLEDARQAMKKSYNTYSHFAVGAALRTEH
jgi:cytidine deaminase